MKQRMIGRITATVGIGIAMFVGYQINRIEIPEGLNDNAAFYRTSTVIFSITIKMVMDLETNKCNNSSLLILIFFGLYYIRLNLARF